MKLHLDNNTVEGSPEELIKYQELLENREEEEVEPIGYTFWYIDDNTFNNRNVLKASPEGYFEDSKGHRYTYQSVKGLIDLVTTESVREAFEEARHEGHLLKYYPVLDMFVKE